MPPHPRSTLFPYTTLFRSDLVVVRLELVEAERPVFDGRPFRNPRGAVAALRFAHHLDRKSTRLNSSHTASSYAAFSLYKKTCYATSPTQSSNASSTQPHI